LWTADKVHRKGRRLCWKMTYLFNPYFCINKLEKKSADNSWLSFVHFCLYVGEEVCLFLPCIDVVFYWLVRIWLRFLLFAFLKIWRVFYNILVHSLEVKHWDLLLARIVSYLVFGRSVMSCMWWPWNWCWKVSCLRVL
jgi:hypothetical protein